MSSGARDLLIPLIDGTVRSGSDAGILMLTADDVEQRGRFVCVGSARLLNFATCGYLGLAQRDELKDAAIAAIRRYGTQFSVSRQLLQLPLYESLEKVLGAITGGHVLVAPTTTLAHQAALPVLVRARDAVILDRFAHASLHVAVGLLGKTRLVYVEHGDLDSLERHIGQLSERYERVFYVFDGLYSMHGDFAPLGRIAALRDAHPKLYLYIDDAHSTSWTGMHGRGRAIDQLSDRSRVVVVLSLNKAFGAAGAAIVFESSDDRDLVRRCGGPLTFSGPIQPAMLGAAVASGKLHLRSDFADLQRQLLERILLTTEVAAQLGVPLANVDRTPIFFVPCHPKQELRRLMRSLVDSGILACPGAFPIVPMGAEGVRFTVSLHNTADDIMQLIETLARLMVRGSADPVESANTSPTLC